MRKTLGSLVQYFERDGNAVLVSLQGQSLSTEWLALPCSPCTLTYRPALTCPSSPCRTTFLRQQSSFQVDLLWLLPFRRLGWVHKAVLHWAVQLRTAVLLPARLPMCMFAHDGLLLCAAGPGPHRPALAAAGWRVCAWPGRQRRARLHPGHRPAHVGRGGGTGRGGIRRGKDAV